MPPVPTRSPRSISRIILLIALSLTAALCLGFYALAQSQPSLSINDVTVAEGDSGTVDAVFTVSLSATSSQTVTVNFATANNSAVAPSDYLSTSGTVSFAPGERTKTIAVTVNGDCLQENNESFLVNLSGAANASISDSQGLGTITTEELPRFLSINDVTVAEGDSGTVDAVFTVTLTGQPGGASCPQAATVNYTTANNSAVSPGDYTATSGTLTFNPGETSKTITVTVNGDCLQENNESFLVNLSGAANATISDSQGLGTITTEELPRFLSINDVTVAEGDSGTVDAVFTVTLTGQPGGASCPQAATVNYTTANNSAVSPGDYTATSGTLTFNPGETSKTITVTVNGDCLQENNESFLVNLSGAANATISDSQGLGTITTEELPRFLSINDVTVAEGDSGTVDAVFTVTLTGQPGGASCPQAATVNYTTANNSAVSPGDYTATSGTLTFNPGETSKTITVTVNGDCLQENNESFLVNLSGAANATISDSQGLGTITTEELPRFLSINDVTVAEGDSGTVDAVFTVTLTGQPGGASCPQAATVNYTTANNSAVSPGDYTATSGTLTFNPGETSKTITVTVNGDCLQENNESFLVNLSGAANATISDSQGLGTITTEELPRFLSINDVTVAEGDSGTVDAVFTVTLTGQPGGASCPQAATVNYTTANNSAVSPGDYTATSGTLTFNPGETSKTITVLVNADLVTETNETFLVNLSGAADATISDSQGLGTITPSQSALVVTNNADSGPGSLRQAIIDANATPGPNTIQFNMAGSGVRTINLLSPLPAITDQVLIDAYSQPGASANTLATGDNAVILVSLIGNGEGNGLTFNTTNSIVRGFSVGNFDSGIKFTGDSSGNRIEGCFLGLLPNGTTGAGNQRGVVVDLNASGNILGGASPAARNVMSGNFLTGITVATGANNIVIGNYFGTNASGTASVPNALYGVEVFGDAQNTRVGGTGTQGNLVSGNSGPGVRIASSNTANTTVQGNRIGTTANGLAALPNSEGIRIDGGTGTIIGGMTDGGGENVIAFNNGAGVRIPADSSTGNAVRSNSIFLNGGLGIDLGADGVTPNDVGDADAGANNLQNFPVLTSAITSGGTTTITGTLNSTPSTAFTIQFFSSPSCDAAGNGEGQTFLGFIVVMTDGLGNANINTTLSNVTSPVITATATDAANNTSEFSQCVTVSGQTQVFAINGRVTDASSNGLNGVTITLSGSQGGTTTTNQNGDYSFGELAGGGTYTLTPSLSGFTFNPASQTFTNLSGNQTANFTGSPTQGVAADLRVTISDTPDPVTVGGALVYFITVDNLGPSGTASGVVLTDTLPANVSFISATTGLGACSQSAGVVICNIGTVSNGVPVPVAILVQPTAAGTLSNTASVAGMESDPNAANNSATATSTVNEGGAVDPNAGITLSGGGAGGSTFELSNDSDSELPAANFPAGVRLTVEDAQLGCSVDTTECQTDAYDGAFEVAVGGALLEAPNPSDLTGGIFTAGPVSLSGLNVTQQYYAARESATVRSLLSLQNLSGAAISVPVDMLIDLGSDSGTTNITSSSGDTTLTTADRYLITDDDPISNDPAITTVFYGPGTIAVPPSALIQLGPGRNGGELEVLKATFNVVVPAGATRRLLFFGQLNATAAAAQSNATIFDSNPALGSDLLRGLSAEQLAEVVNYNFTGVTVGLSISGRIADGGNNGMAGINVALSGSQSLATTTDGNGNYAFTSLAAGGNYTVTPTRANFTFAPPSTTFNNLTSNQTANFTGTQTATVTLTGLVQFSTNSFGSFAGGQVWNSLGGDSLFNLYAINGPLGGSFINSGNGPSASLNVSLPDGDYLFTVHGEPGGNTGFAGLNLFFNGNNSTPGISVTAPVKTDQATDPSFSANSGSTLTLSGSSVAGAGTLTFTSGTTVVTLDQYFWAVPQVFTTDRVTPSNNTASGSNDFVGQFRLSVRGNQSNVGSITGQITDGVNPLSGVTVTLSGSQSATTTTDGSGNYAFANLVAGGNFTVTPSLANFTFTPPSQTFNNLTSNQTANFTGTPVPVAVFSISGRVDSGAGVTVTLSGTQSGVTTTDGSGNYSFANLAVGGSYTVTPTRTNYTFAPASLSFANLSGNVLNANFTGTLLNLSISGRVTDGNGNGIADVGVTLAGAGSQTITTDSNGNYRFGTVAANGNYLVTPSKFGFTFTPLNQSYSSLSSEQVANFVAAAIPNPTPTPTPSEDFDDGTTGPNFTAGTLTTTPTSNNPNVTVTVQNGQLVITPLAGANGANFNGIVLVKPIDLNVTPIVSIEAVQVQDEGTTSFALGNDGDNWYRFAAGTEESLEQSGAGTAGAAAKAVLKRRSGAEAEKLLFFQTNLGGTKFSTNIPYDPVAHRFWRFRFGEPTAAAAVRAEAVMINFETSPDAKVWTLRYSTTLAPNRPVTGLVAEIAAGTSSAAVQPGKAIFDNFALSTEALPGNRIDQTDFFVRQQYLDFLNREPDGAGQAYWLNEIERCGGNARCVQSRRVGVSAAFFVEQEFQQTGSLVYRLYQAAFKRRVSFAEFQSDRVRLMIGGSLEASKQALAAEFVTRAGFRNIYDGVGSVDYVDRLYANAGVTATQEERAALVLGLLTNRLTRGQVLLFVAENQVFAQQQFNAAFVLTQYFGYLRRDPDEGGFMFWVDVLNNRVPNNYVSMVCAFINSREYQLRFGTTVTHTDAECASQ